VVDSDGTAPDLRRLQLHRVHAGHPSRGRVDGRHHPGPGTFSSWYLGIAGCDRPQRSLTCAS